MSEAGAPGTRGFRVTGWGAGACCRNPERSEGPHVILATPEGVELEALSRRERSRGPRYARFSRDGVGSGSLLPKS
jgi:hypothetical protein